MPSEANTHLVDQAFSRFPGNACLVEREHPNLT